MNLLLDLGNTRLKWARHDGARLVDAGAVAWDAFAPERLPQSLLDAARGTRGVLAASVAGAEREALVAEALRARGLEVPAWVRTPAEACGVRNAYRIPGKLGVDRFLGLVAALHAGLAPCVVVSAGTALTLDALSADGRHLGGLIAPGPRLMQRALHQAAAQLPDPGDAALVEVADDTESAIASGCWQACLGLIERFHARMHARLGGIDTTVILSGGDAGMLASQLQVPAQVRPDLVLQGLAVWDAASSSAP